MQDLRQFTRWWWRAGQPYLPPVDNTRRMEGTHEFVLYRHGPFQVEQVTLYPHIEVPPHSHPNVRTYECHVAGGGDAWLHTARGWEKVPYKPDPSRHVMHRRLLIEAGQRHKGVAHVVNVVLSFQHWLNEVPPDFLTNDWEGEPWR